MPPTKDPVGLVLASIGAGSTSGAAVITAGMIILRTMQASRGVDRTVNTGFAVIWVTLILGIALAVLTGWALTRALDDMWRRGVVGALSVFGTALLAGIGMPVDLLTGRIGLTVYLLITLAAALYMRAVALRSSST